MDSTRSMASGTGAGEPATFRGVTHVFLDVGGTLGRAEPSTPDVYRQVLSNCGFSVERTAIARILDQPATIYSLVRRVEPIEQPEFFRAYNSRVLEHLGVEPHTEVLRQIDVAFDAQRWEPYPDAIPTMTTLRDADVRLGVISNASHDLPPLLARVGFAAFLGTVTYSFDVGADKPHPRIFRHALAQAGVTAETCLHVGDGYEPDYLGARRAGLHALLLVRSGSPPEPCPHIASLVELPRLLGLGGSPK